MSPSEMISPHHPRELGLLRLGRWVFGYALRRRFLLTMAVLAMLARIGVELLKPWPLALLVDHGLRGKDMPDAVAWSAGLLSGTATPQAFIGACVAATVVLFLLGWGASLATAYAGVSLGQRMVYDLASDLFSRLQHLSLRFHTSRSVGDNLRRVTADCACVSVIAKDALLPVLSAVVSLVMMFGVMWRLSPALTLLALAVVPCMMEVFRRYARPMMDLSCRQQEVESRIYRLVEETFSSMPVVQAFGQETSNDSRLQQAHRDTLTATLALTNVQLHFKMLMGMATAVGTAAILWVGVRQTVAGEASVGVLLVFLSYLGSLYGPLEAIMYTSAIVQSAAGSAARVREVLEAPQEVADKPGAVAPSSVAGRVRLEQVTFGYQPRQPVLADISLEVQPGEIIALVGPSGAGKSSLVSLLPRFFDPWQGRVLLDGRDVRDLPLKALRQNIGLVLQEPFLFPQTVAANIAYGRPGATQAEIEAAARVAQAHEFIIRMPQGYETLIGERGATLSGGERQRLSIARALLRNAPILILDEPASALDAETEQLLLDALNRLLVGRTTFIIAHRLSTVLRATRIVFLEHGRLTEMGSHQELLARGGRYAAFHRALLGLPMTPSQASS